MAHWAIAIGINQYQNQKLQPLLYAQRDAQSLCDFLVQEADFSPSHCLTLCDFAAGDLAPTRSNLSRTIEQVCQSHLTAEDVLWCFFSGYGIQHSGSDYLMPIDSDPDRPDETGIAIDRLFQLLSAAPTQKVVLLLDVNRSHSSGEGVGNQTLALARKYGIATILSSQPQQFSHETIALRQGLFTAALIEAIRYRGCFTLDQLVEYLTDRLPELSEQHWRPRQDPIAFVPVEQKYQLIVPEAAAVRLNVSAPVGVGAAEGEAGSAEIRSWLERSFASSAIDEPAVALHPPSPDQQPISNPAEPQPIPTPAAGTAALLPQDPFWQRLLLWGSVLVGVLIVGVLLRNAAVVFGRPKSNPASAPAPNVVAPAAPAPTLPTLAVPLDPATIVAAAQTALQSRQYQEASQQLGQLTPDQQTPDTLKLLEQANRGLLNQAKSMTSRTREPAAENQASDFVDAIEIARVMRPGQPLYEEAQQNIDRWSQIILDMAQGRADRSTDPTVPPAENYGGAIRTALLVPNDRPEVYARAQQSVAQWSQLIFQIAQEQAAQGNLDLAIQTAEGVPPNTPTYPKAQESIAEWRRGQPPVNPPAPVQ